MAHNISFSKGAQKDLARISKKDSVRIMQKIESVFVNEERGDVCPLQPPLHGFRLRVGVYRVLYTNDERCIEIHAVRRRGGVYKK
jgi:mRNA-degrading endonuclease RelE of RelBE toxin-antitoxin system